MARRTIIQRATAMGQQHPDWLKEILQKQTFLHYHAFYQGYKQNHNSQAITALSRLGASKDLVERFIEVSKQVVRPYEHGAELKERVEMDSIQSDNMDDYLGKNEAFYKLYDLYRKMYKQKYNGDIKKMLKDVFPRIVDGPLFSAFHSIIQMGYGVAAKSDSMILEGLTYMFQQYSPLFFDDLQNPKRVDLSSFGKGERPLLDVLSDLRNSDIVKKIEADNTKYENAISKIHIILMSALKHHSDLFMDSVNNIKLPEWFSTQCKDIKQLERLCDWVFDMATVLYVKSDCVNNFYFVHGITGSWSARQVFPLLDYDPALLGVRSLLSGLMIVYVHQKTPTLNKNPEDFFSGEVNQGAWDDLISSVLNSESVYECHVYKVIQCLYERWQQYPSGDFARFYIAGACAVKDNAYGGLSKSK